MKQLLICFLFSAFINAQTKSSIFFGKIFDDLGKLENVHIINLKTNTATYTNPQGIFKIFAKKNDSIKITAVGYKNKVLVLNATDFGINEKQIHLEKEIIKLDEINIKNHNLLGSLSSDVKNVKTEEKLNAQTLLLPNAGNRKLTVAERRLYTAYGGNLLGIDYIINVLSGRIKKLKKFKRIEDNEKEIKELKNLFTYYIIQDLKIDSTNVSRFIYYCQENEDYKKINVKNEFEVIKYLKNKASNFKKLNKQ